MKFTVRSKDGELSYESFGQVEQAWLMGLIDPGDELLEEGHTKWRRADTIPLLIQARRRGDDVWTGSWFLWALVGIIGGSYALYLFQQKEWLYGFVLATVIATLMVNVTMRAHKRRKPH